MEALITDLGLIIAGCLLIGGGFFAFVAALGILRLGDVYLRMHASTKAATLGVGMILLAVAVYFDRDAVTMRALAVIAFILLTIPVGSHLLGRAAYRAGVPMAPGSRMDEWKDRMGGAEGATPPASQPVDGRPEGTTGG